MYDALSNLKTQTDARGCVLSLNYDNLNRLTSKTSAGSCGTQVSSTYTYDYGTNGKGLRTGMADASGSTAWSYDERGRMLAESKTISGAGTYGTTWAYNAADLPVSMTYPGDGETVAFDYNDRMLPEKLRDTKNTPGNPADDSFYVSSTSYDLAGRISGRGLGSGLTQAFSYYKWDEKASVDGQQVGQGGRLKTMTAGALQDMNYLYDAAGNIRQVMNTSAGETNAYGYDALNRLTGWTLNGTPESYSYDPVTGNLDIKAGVDLNYNDAAHKHAVTHIGAAQKYWYDANGSQTKRIIGPDTYDLAYDAENRLTQVKKNSTVFATFTYDGDGSRVKSVTGSETTGFIGGHYEVTNPGSGQTVTKYYFAGATRVAMRKYTIPQSDTLTYLLGDHLGSTSLAVTGNEVIETRYKPWGEVRFTTDGKTLPTRYTYTGQYSHVSDDATDLGSAGFGLMFYNARWMDPALGRFAQADTIVPGGVQGLDRYAYVNNNPLRYTDPSGHKCVPEEECQGNTSSYSGVPTPTWECSIIGYSCRPSVPEAPKNPPYIAPPISPDKLTEKGKVVMEYYVYLKSLPGYQNMTLVQFLGLMMMYEINGHPDAQEWNVKSAIDQLFAADHGKDTPNPYCGTGTTECIAGIFDYLGNYSQSAYQHAYWRATYLPPRLAIGSTGNVLDDATKIGNLIMNGQRPGLKFQGIHFGNTWMKPWLRAAKNHLNIVDDPSIANGLLALNDTYMAFSIVQENFWICVMENGYGHC